MSRPKKKYLLPAGYSLLQTALNSNEFLDNPVKFIAKSMDKFSGTYTASLGRKKKIILTQNPDFINYILKENHRNYNKSEFATERAVLFLGKGLLLSNDDYWLRQRRLIQPAFHREKIQALYEIVIRTIDDFLLKFPTGDSVDIYPPVYELAFNIIVRSLFNIDLPTAILLELNEIFTEIQGFLFKDINQPFRRLFYPVTGTEKLYLKKAERLREIVSGIIEERRKSGLHFSDLLDMLLQSRYEDTGEGMTDEQLIDEAFIIIFAGHETTANTLSWLLHLLSVNQPALQKLRASLEENTVHNCLNDEYLKATIYESTRIYPPAWMTERVALEDDTFGEFSFAKNTIIVPFFFGMHRDGKLWKDELQFAPERFIENPKLLKSPNFVPFGAGPRMCIGNNFAMAEMCFFVFSFLEKFQFTATAQVPEMIPLITLRPDKVVLDIRRRDASAAAYSNQ